MYAGVPLQDPSETYTTIERGPDAAALMDGHRSLLPALSIVAPATIGQSPSSTRCRCSDRAVVDERLPLRLISVDHIGITRIVFIVDVRHRLCLLPLVGWRAVLRGLVLLPMHGERGAATPSQPAVTVVVRRGVLLIASPLQ